MNRIRTGLWLSLTIVVLTALSWAAFELYAKDASAQTSLMYIPNAGEGTVSVVDFEQGKVMDTIRLPSEQASHGIAVSPDGTVIYAGTGFEGKTLVAIHADSKSIEKELTFDEGVHGIDISPDGAYLYISLNPGLGQSEGGGLAVVSAASLKLKTIVETGPGPAHVAVSKDGSQIWVANVNDNTVAVIDGKTHELIAVIPVGEVPNEVAVSPDGRWAFSANVKSNTVTVIDAKTLQTVQEISAGEAPHGVTVSPDGKELWVSNNKSNDVTVVDLSSFEAVATIPTGSYANHVAFTGDGQWAFVTNRQSNDVVKIKTADRQVVASIAVGVEPHEISLEDYPYGSGEVQAASTDPSEEGIAENVQAAATIEDRSQSGWLGDVEMEVKYIVADDQAPEGLTSNDLKGNEVFRISFTTHTGDASTIVDADRVKLVNGSSGKTVPARWLVESKDSHHPSFIALFPKVESAGGNFTLEVEGEAETVMLKWENGFAVPDDKVTLYADRLK